MNGLPLSIIVPVFNMKQTVARALRSALRQTIAKEIIVIDDCSIDGSYEKVKFMQRFHPEILLFRMETHSGSGACRNRGLMECRGEFVAFLDADDVYPDKTALKKMYDLAHMKKVSVCRSLRQLYIDRNLNYKRTFREECIKHPEGLIKSFKDCQYEYDYTSYIFERKILEGIQFPELSRYQDVVFFVNVMLKNDRFAVADVEGYRYTIDSKRPVRYDLHSVRDLLTGIYTVKKLAEENQLNALNDRCNRRLEEYMPKISEFCNDPDIADLISKIQN